MTRPIERRLPPLNFAGRTKNTEVYIINFAGMMKNTEVYFTGITKNTEVYIINFAGITKNTKVYIIPAKVPILTGGQDLEDAGN